jgi:uncharacterized membrane protein YcaP (DUF421 family)
METDFEPLAWGRVLLGEQPPLYFFEVLFKVVVIFCLLLLIMRLLGKRGQKNLSPMQQMLLIALGSSAGDALLYPTVSLLYAATILVSVTLLTMWMDRATVRYRRVRDYVESHPRVLVRDGVIDQRALHKERTNVRELNAALRCAGARSIEQVELAILEVSGAISVFLNDHHATHDDLLEALVEAVQEEPAGNGGRRPPGVATGD